ncbi:MAG: hypothetical protein J7497_15125 [Chitinophagaceae bacterium]|nr:hypothetical protein [Chitinophagaceae bacterium]
MAVTSLLTVFYARETLRDTRTFFNKQNQPYLQVANLSLKGDSLLFDIVNLGSFPAKIDGGKFGYMSLNPSEVGWDERLLGWYSYEMFNRYGKTGDHTLTDTTLLNTYVIKEIPIRRIKVKANLDWSIVLNKGEVKNYFFGSINYQDEVTQDRRTYIFSIIVNPSAPNQFSFIYSGNHFAGEKVYLN